MKIPNIKLRSYKICVQPANDSTSSFTAEHKKYERKSVAYIVAVGEDIPKDFYREGAKVIYDDSKSIDFTYNGLDLSIIEENDIVAFIEEDK